MIRPDPTLAPILVPPAGGKVLRAFGEEVIMHLSGEQTGGNFCLWTEVTLPGGGPPPHYHLNEDETFFVLEGRIAFYRDGTWTEASPGTIVFMPRNVIHAFKNVGETTSRMLISTTPSGFDVFFEKCAAEFAKPGAPDMPKIFAISAEHGIHFVNE